MGGEPIRRGLRIISSPRRGSSWPVVVETDEGLFFTKLRGAAHGTAPLIAEIIVAELADAVGLPIPRRALVFLEEQIECPNRDPELLELLAASRGVNLGFRPLDSAREIRPHEVAAVGDDFACRTLWLDALVMNPDRTDRNPNVLISEGRPWLVDHGATLPFQYNWAAVSEHSPRAPYTFDRHLFRGRTSMLLEWDERLAPMITRAVLESAVTRVPDAFLEAQLPASPDADRVARRRRAYEAFLWKRLKAPRPFIMSSRTADRGAVSPPPGTPPST